MPNHNIHAIVGIVTGLSMVYLLRNIYPLPYVGFVIIIMVAYLYSILPDIDIDTSYANKIWNITAAGIVTYYIFTGQHKFVALLALFSIVILEFVKHRGVTHTVGFIIITSLPLYYLHPTFFVAAATSGISHLVADKMK